MESFSIGDEDRRKIFIKHKNHHELGFTNHKNVLRYLSLSEIAVVFQMGRTLEEQL